MLKSIAANSCTTEKTYICKWLFCFIYIDGHKKITLANQLNMAMVIPYRVWSSTNCVQRYTKSPELPNNSGDFCDNMQKNVFINL